MSVNRSKCIISWSVSNDCWMPRSPKLKRIHGNILETKGSHWKSKRRVSPLPLKFRSKLMEYQRKFSAGFWTKMNALVLVNRNDYKDCARIRLTYTRITHQVRKRKAPGQIRGSNSRAWRPYAVNWAMRVSRLQMWSSVCVKRQSVLKSVG